MPTRTLALLAFGPQTNHWLATSYSLRVTANFPLHPFHFSQKFLLIYFDTTVPCQKSLGCELTSGKFSRMNLAELPQVQSLTVRENLDLADDLWKSISSELDKLEVTQEDKDMLDERWFRFLQNPSSTLTVDMFKQELNALRA
jgi:putative addiction module component (TIGR02574 family)